MSISEAEAQVMQVLWQDSPRTAEAIVAALVGPNDWAEATVKTLINRLLNKGAIDAEKQGRRYCYRPRLQRDEWLSQQSQGLVDRLFGGRVAPLVAHFSEQGKLSAKDIAELKQLIQELDDGN